MNEVDSQAAGGHKSPLGESETGAALRTRPRSDCPVCGGPGQSSHRDLVDQVWGAPGRWNMARCVDRACDLRWLDPMPIAEDIGMAYRNYSTHAVRAPSPDPPGGSLFERMKRAHLARLWGYPRKQPDRLADMLSPLLVFMPQQRARLAASVAHLRAEGRGRLLDVGCGAGDTLVRLRELGWHTQGVDLDPRAVEVARTRGLRVALGSLAAQNYPPDHFSAIILSHTIEHIHEPRALIRECFRILAPGGRLAIETPNAAAWCHVLFGSRWRGLEPPRHLQIFTLGSLGRVIRDAGFDLEYLATSAKAAAFFASASMTIAAAGDRGTPTQDRWGSATAALGAVAAASEVLLLALVPDVGEELVLVGRKPVAVYEAPIPVEDAQIAPMLAPESAA